MQVQPSNIYFHHTSTNEEYSPYTPGQFRPRFIYEDDNYLLIVVSSTMNHITYQVTLYLNLSILCTIELYNHINSENPIDQYKI